MLINQHAC